VENLVHLTVSGHVAHDEEVQDDHGSHRDIEHGCVAGFHVCVCCSHQPMLFNPVEVPLLHLPTDTQTFGLPWVTGGPAGEDSRVFRPPVV
jgi:hypothetical protein